MLIVTIASKPLGGYMAKVFQGQSTVFDGPLRPLERLLYRITGVNPEKEMDWKEYASSFVLFGLCGTLLLYVILRL